MEDITDELLEYLLENKDKVLFQYFFQDPEIASQLYPEIMPTLKDKFNRRNVVVWAFIFKTWHKYFPTLKFINENFEGIRKRKMLEGWIYTADFILNDYPITNEIEKSALNSVRDELLEYKMNLELELVKLSPPKPSLAELWANNLNKDGEEIHYKPITIGNGMPVCFNDIFVNEDWRKYFLALQKTTPPLIDSNNNFIGKIRLHKGVICSWFKDLQNKGIINRTINRATLALVLNNEIKNLNLGKDGKTFDNYSAEYENEFEEQLLMLIK